MLPVILPPLLGDRCLLHRPMYDHSSAPTTSALRALTTPRCLQHPALDSKLHSPRSSTPELVRHDAASTSGWPDTEISAAASSMWARTRNPLTKSPAAPVSLKAKAPKDAPTAMLATCSPPNMGPIGSSRRLIVPTDPHGVKSGSCTTRKTAGCVIVLVGQAEVERSGKADTTKHVVWPSTQMK